MLMREKESLWRLLSTICPSRYNFYCVYWVLLDIWWPQHSYLSHGWVNIGFSIHWATVSGYLYPCLFLVEKWCLLSLGGQILNRLNRFSALRYLFMWSEPMFRDAMLLNREKSPNEYMMFLFSFIMVSLLFGLVLDHGSLCWITFGMSVFRQ